MEKGTDRSSWGTRRSFVRGSGAIAVGTLLGSRVLAGPKKIAKGLYPFSLGIASGDPTPTGVVLWTRLAPDPLVPGGGMPSRQVEVSFQIAKDEAMTRVIASGTATASPQWAHSVHVEVEGLQPDSWYWYQFSFGGELSPKGRTRTLPLPSVMPEKLRFAYASCQNYEFGYYTAYDHLAREAPDLVVHLGDYIYEKHTSKPNVMRRHNTGTCMTLDDYRGRYALYKSDLLLQRAHEVAPWIVTWDDHEFADNCSGEIPVKPKAAREYLSRRAAAYQAYFEHMPLRAASVPSGPDMLLYRNFMFGKLAAFQVLDTRQYRTKIPYGRDKIAAQGKAALSSKATILGSTQKNWLFDNLVKSGTTWNVIAQQVMMARIDLTRGEETGYNMDKWAGYENDRRQLIRHLQQQRVTNPVVITGDIHSNWANQIVNDFDGKRPMDVAVELVGTSISSGGNGEDQPARNDWLLAENPHVKFQNNERGYVMCEVTPELWRADFRTVESITRMGAPLRTRASFVVEPGAPRLVRT